MTQRFLEIDRTRGVAVLLMVVFHLAYDLTYFDVLTVQYWTGGWLLLARVVQFLFILTTGITLVLAYERDRERGRPAVKTRARHALKIFGWGMVITLITTVLFKDEAVKFGILHFYGVAIFLALPLLRFKKWNALLGLGVMALAIPLEGVNVESPWLFPLGLHPLLFKSLDYFPLVPWFGLFLIGVALAYGLYPNGKRRFPEPFRNLPHAVTAPLEALGRHSLAIYLLHQPIIVGLIQLVRALT